MASKAPFLKAASLILALLMMPVVLWIFAFFFGFFSRVYERGLGVLLSLSLVIIWAIYIVAIYYAMLRRSLTQNPLLNGKIAVKNKTPGPLKQITIFLVFLLFVSIFLFFYRESKKTNNPIDSAFTESR